MKEISEEHHKAYIRQLIYENRVIEAIKYIRELTGMGLKESKDLCNSFMNDLSQLDDYSFFENNVNEENEDIETNITVSDQELIENIKAMLQRGEKLLAVKFAKEVLNIGLKEAKTFVESLYESESETELIIAGANNDMLIEQHSEREELKVSDKAEGTLKIILDEDDIKIKKPGKRTKTYKKSESITFGKIAVRDKQKNRKRTNSGCMVTLMIMLIITLSVGIFIYF